VDYKKTAASSSGDGFSFQNHAFFFECAKPPWANLNSITNLRLMPSRIPEVESFCFARTDGLLLTPHRKWRPYRESNPGYLREREVS
jgi:hypothetical protein